MTGKAAPPQYPDLYGREMSTVDQSKQLRPPGDCILVVQAPRPPGSGHLFGSLHTQRKGRGDVAGAGSAPAGTSDLGRGRSTRQATTRHIRHAKSAAARLAALASVRRADARLPFINDNNRLADWLPCTAYQVTIAGSENVSPAERRREEEGAGDMQA